MPIFVVTVFLGSFLLFAVEPMVAKFLLPSFGGTAAVWSTCLVVFQTLLLAGYAYAHLLRTTLSPKAQRWTHLGCLPSPLLSRPPPPPSPWAQTPAAHPFGSCCAACSLRLACPSSPCPRPDRKSTRLNSSHANISYAV